MDAFLRFLALIGILALPAAWVVSLSGDPELFRANLARTAGALAGGAVAWAWIRQSGTGPAWTACLFGGVAGSLLVSASSVILPALGRVTAAGWLTSGVVGGAVIALATYAVRGTEVGLEF